MADIQLGATYTFVPSAFISESSGGLLGQKALPREVSGVISFINWTHRFFTVTADGYCGHLRESFKF